MNNSGIIYKVYEYASGRPRVFAEYEWALNFAKSEIISTLEWATVSKDIGTDFDRQEAEGILEGGLLSPEEWVIEEQIDNELVLKTREAGVNGILFSSL